MEGKEEQNAGNSDLRHEKWKGGIKTMPFIFANEVSEKLAVVGFSANMVSYLTEKLHMPMAKAATTLTNFGGTASLTPLVGAFLADAYIGRFWTIAAATFIYLIGMSSLTASAVLPQFRPPPCAAGAHNCKEASAWQLAVLYASLFLAALGAGGIRPCVVAFGAEQFGEADERERRRTWRFFNWYYFCMGASMLLAVTVVVYVQDNVGWGWGLGIPTVAMGISLLSFVAGYPMYMKAKPAGSPFTRLAQVAVAAVRKRRLSVVMEAGLLYENDELDAGISMAGKLGHTSSLSFLDKAAIVTEKDNLAMKPSSSSSSGSILPNLWHLNTVHRVEELKSVIRMAPIWAAGILVITASAQQNTFSLQQARIMNRRISPSSSFLIPPGSMTVFTMLSMLSTISLYDRLLVPLARRFTGLDRGISFLLRMGIGFVLSAMATLIAGLVELHRRRSAAKSANPISVFWLVPQYGLFGAAEAFTSIGHLEFFYDQAPESMRSTAAGLFWLSISAGSYVSTMLVGLLHRYSNWLADDLNKGRLEFLYWIITGLQVMNLGYYMVCASFYTYKPLLVRDQKSSGGDDQSAGVELLTKV